MMESTESLPELQSRRRAALLVGAAFFILQAIKLWRHEFWADELQAWMIAANSGSLKELFQRLQHESHPALWYLILYALNGLTPNPEVMKIVHLLVATATVVLVMRFGPWKAGWRALFCFGYFPFFEYATISRSYAFGVLGLVLFCVLFCAKRRNNVLIALVLLFMTQTNAHALMIAFVLATLWLFALAAELKSKWMTEGARIPWKWAIPLLAVFAGFGGVFLQLLPSNEIIETTSGLDIPLAGRAINTIWKAYVPVPVINPYVWNSNIVDSGLLQAVVSVLMIPVIVVMFLRRPSALYVVVVCSGLIVAFSYYKYMGWVRHHGHLFMVLIAGWWLAEALPTWDPPFRRVRLVAAWGDLIRNPIIWSFLLIQLSVGLYASVSDLARPFSAAKSVADYIRDHGFGDLPIVGDRDANASTVAGYLRKPIFYVSWEDWGTFIQWEKKRGRNAKPEKLPPIVERLAAQSGQDHLLVLTYPWPGNSDQVELLAAFRDSIVFNEKFYLYRYPSPEERVAE
jgi:hypothetical protein